MEFGRTEFTFEVQWKNDVMTEWFSYLSVTTEDEALAELARLREVHAENPLRISPTRYRIVARQSTVVHAVNE